MRCEMLPATADRNRYLMDSARYANRCQVFRIVRISRWQGLLASVSGERAVVCIVKTDFAAVAELVLENI